MLERVQGNGSGFFTQSAAGYAQQEKLGPNQNQTKTAGAFLRKEWSELLESEIHQAENAFQTGSRAEIQDKQKEQVEDYILGSSARTAVDLEQWLAKGTSPEDINQMESGKEEEGKKKGDMADSIPETVAEELIQKLLGKDRQAPYSSLADENGVVTYHGVSFQCDYENNRICLGDVSNLQNCITVSLEKGGCLVVNRDNIDQLSKAIGMFSPEDVNRIMRAIAQDAKIRQTQMQIEDEVSGVEVLKNPEDSSQEELSVQETDSDKERKHNT